MAVYNQRQMETLSDTLAGRRRKPRSRSTGKITPVSRVSNPYVRPSRGGGSSPTASGIWGSDPNNLLGMLAQERNRVNRPPVDTNINVNYESDPVLARIKALNTQNVENARSEAAKVRKQALIESGLGNVGQELGLDAETIQAANSNPFSTRATIERTAAERGRELDESLNQQNLFFSGHRAQQLGNLSHSTAEAQTRLGTDLRSILGQADAGVLAAEQAARAEEQAAIEAAAEAARQQAFLESMFAPYGEEVMPTDPGVFEDALPATGGELPTYTPYGPDDFYYGDNLAYQLALMNPLTGLTMDTLPGGRHIAY